MSAPLQTLQTIERETGPAPAAAIIWLHGLGADGHDFEPLVDELTLPVAVRYVFPHAPTMPVTINGGMVMRAWYDIVSPDLERRADERGVRASAALVQGLIDREKARGIAPGRIVLAGFSQGGAIALHAGLRQGEPLAGVLALSCYLPLASALAGERAAASAKVPLFMAHGVDDEIVPIDAAERSRDVLRGLGYEPEWHAYAMPHSVSMEEIADIAAWLQRVLAA